MEKRNIKTFWQITIAIFAMLICSCSGLKEKNELSDSTYVYFHKCGYILLDSVPLLKQIVRDLRMIDSNATIVEDSSDIYDSYPNFVKVIETKNDSPKIRANLHFRNYGTHVKIVNGIPLLRCEALLPSELVINHVNFGNKKIPYSVDSLYKISNNPATIYFHNCLFSYFPVLNKYGVKDAVIFVNTILPEHLILEKKHLPDSFRVLTIHNSNIKSISFKDSFKIEILNLHDNKQLTHLDSSVSKIKGLKKIYVYGCPMEILPLDNLSEIEFVSVDSLADFTKNSMFLKKYEKVLSKHLQEKERTLKHQKKSIKH
jgi:hypothetical protein